MTSGTRKTRGEGVSQETSLSRPTESNPRLSAEICGADRIRNGGPLEYPTSPIFVDKKLCLTQSDTSRRDNAPNSAGEVGPGIAGPLLGKISCLDQALPQAGLPLPVH